jgi:hypothetical protein
MKSRIEKLLAAARAHHRAEEPPPVPPGLGRRLARQATDSPAPAPDAAWLRGLAAGFACAAVLATGTAFLPRPERAEVVPELFALAGIAGETEPEQP